MIDVVAPHEKVFVRAVLVMPGVDTAGNRTTTLLMIPAVGHYRNGNACTNERARPSSFF
jgi:hypothetical protein